MNQIQTTKPQSSSELQRADTRISKAGILFDGSLTADQIEDAIEYFEDVFPLAPKNTVTAYDTGLMIYRQFCVSHNRLMVETDLKSLRRTLSGYIDWLVERGNRKVTISNRLATVVVLLDICKLPNLFRTDRILKDKKKNLFKQLSGWQSQAEPVEGEMIELINEKFIVETPRDLRDLAIVNCMYDGLLRSDELQGVQLKHINPEENTLFLPTSKGDKESEGTYRQILEVSINLINEWCNEMEIKSGPVFVPLHCKGKSILKGKNGEPHAGLTGRHIQRIVKRVVKAVTGTDENFSSHSMRVGKARTEFKHGVPAEKIALMGGWSSVDMVMKYCRNISLRDL